MQFFVSKTRAQSTALFFDFGKQNLTQLQTSYSQNANRAEFLCKLLEARGDSVARLRWLHSWRQSATRQCIHLFLKQLQCKHPQIINPPVLFGHLKSGSRGGGLFGQKIRSKKSIKPPLQPPVVTFF